MQIIETHLTKKIRSEVGAKPVLGVITAVQAASRLVNVTKAPANRCGKLSEHTAE